MDIGAGNGYPSSALSNFAPHPFVFDGVKVNSFEGLLQSFKFKEPDMQAHVCTLVGRAAKFKGKHKNWQTTQTLWWRGRAYKRDSDAYQNLLDRAYDAMIKAWCLEHLGQELEVTCSKDYGMILLYDDRAVQIIPNTGRRADGQA